jgi:hypothetical protein
MPVFDGKFHVVFLFLVGNAEALCLSPRFREAPEFYQGTTLSSIISTLALATVLPESILTQPSVAFLRKPSSKHL